jgi:hypothetical protein
MDTRVAERPRTVIAPPALVDQSDVALEQSNAGERRLPQPDEWRWVPDPADVEVPPSAEHRTWQNSPFIRALAWASVQ